MSSCRDIIHVTRLNECTTSVSSLTSNSANVFQSTVELYLISLFCVAGLTGNMLSLVVLQRDKERRNSMFLLKALAIADTFYLCVALINYPLKYLIDMENYQHMILYAFPVLKIAQFMCIWMLVLVTVDRFLYVKVPMRAIDIINHNNRHFWAAGVCVLAILYNLPRFFDSCVMTFYDVCTDKYSYLKVSTGVFKNQLYFYSYEYSAYMIVLYVGPLLILSYMNTTLIRTIRRSLKRQFNQFRHAPHDHSDANATQVLVIIIVVFIVCESPELIVKILSIIDRCSTNVTISLSLFKIFATINEFLMVVNSSVNFVIYLTFGKRFRMIMRDTLRLDFFETPTYV